MKTEVIIVTSGKGGTGETTFTANLGYSLAKQGFKTCIIDLDFYSGKLDLILGLESEVEYNISHIISNNEDTLKALIKDKKNSNLFILPSPRSDERVTLSQEKLSIIVEQLKSNDFEFILIDCPTYSSKEELLNISAQLSNKAIVITNPEKPSLRDADSVISVLENITQNHKDRIFLVINKYIEPKAFSNKGILKSKDIQRILAIPLLGTVSYNTKNSIALNKSVPVVTINSKSFNEYKSIINELLKSHQK